MKRSLWYDVVVFVVLCVLLTVAADLQDRVVKLERECRGQCHQQNDKRCQDMCRKNMHCPMED